MSKILDIISTDDAIVKIPDLKTWGNGDLFVLLSKVSSQRLCWMESTYAMQAIDGCVVKVTTFKDGQLSSSVCFVPKVSIIEERGSDGAVISRKLV